MLLALVLTQGCRRGGDQEPPRPAGRLPLVLLHQPLWGDPAPFRELLAEFEAAHPSVELRTQLMPNASEVAHQFLLTALEGGSRDFDVFVADVVWVPELARAGWIADLSDAFPPDALREEMLPGPAETAIAEGRTRAVPWYVDVGLLYYRTDLVPAAPRAYAELEQYAREAMAREPGIRGFVWQGRQYEGMVCNVYEALWGHGGETMRDGRLLLDSDEARKGLGWLVHLLSSGISPASVTSMAEEDARRVFEDGRAVFMRNWPYAWRELQREGSPVRGKVGYAPLPTVSGVPGSGALGGWQLVLNARTPKWKRKAAVALIAHLTSADANLRLATGYARNPARRAVYSDPRLAAQAPYIAGLLPIVERARPRPVTPYYLLLSEVLQGEFSAALAGIREPAEALARAQKATDRIVGEAP